MKQSTKNLEKYLLIITGIIFCSLLNAEAIPDSTLNVTYIGGTGYLLESTNYRILIEPTYGDIIKSFGYPYADSSIENDINYGRGLFDSIDLFLISHVHDGHFDVEKTLSCFSANPEALIITTSQVYEKLENASNNFTSLKDRIYVPDLDLYEMFDTTINDISFIITEIEHWGSTTLLQYYFRINGMGIGYYLDYVPREGENLHVKTDSLDLCIIDGNIFLNDDRREIFQNDFEVEYGVFTHFNDFDNMDKKLEENHAEFPNCGYLKGSMEKVILSKRNNEISIDTINQQPVCIADILSDTFDINEDIDVQLPEILFSDPDGNDLTVTVSQVNGDSLPSWLDFNFSTMKFSGQSDKEQTLKIRFIATDPNHAWNYLDYKLMIKSSVSSIIKPEVNNKQLIYPTLAIDVLTINLTNPDALYNTFAIFNLAGEAIKEGVLNPESLIQVNIEALPAGNYIVRLHGCSSEYSCKFVKK